VAGVEQYASPVLQSRTNEVAVEIPEPPELNGTDLLRGVTFGWLGREVAKLEREGGLGIDHQVGC
jgi:hypothetical protein